ncbi:MAG: hypothetical protein K2H52_16520 [Lachnospiraceae bacterium]|nr:hypothetical protein [Lachnospiraceae bacterium]MDE7287606.1 hypothetical protein [Lachnospiraceae bacterium]
MSKAPKKRSIILPFVIGIFLGITAKLVDVPNITYRFPIFDDVMARFGIWVWAAAFIAILSKSPLFAAVRSFVFFVGMLSAYYGYTILFLKFFPKSQIVLWSCIAMITPFCGFLIWHIHLNKWFANLIASFPFILFFTEWYLTSEDTQLLFIPYLCMALSWLSAVPTNKKRLFSLLYGLSISIILILLIRAEIITNIYERLLNI